MRLAILSLALLTLAACSDGAAAPADAAKPDEAPIAAPAQALLVPDRFHGIWDYEKGSCDPASDIAPRLRSAGSPFYESHGAVTALTVESPERITVELAMQGEGEKWTMTRTFALSQGDTILTPTGGGGTGKPMPLKRCA